MIHWFNNWFRPKYIVADYPLMSEEELAGQFAVPITDKRFSALLQIIDELEREANAAAQKSVASHGICASSNGGAEHIGILRDRILALREQGFGKLSSDRQIG